MIRKRILLYNWAAFDNPEHDGGGVTVYLANLVDALQEKEEYECYFLSSGSKYTFDNRLRIVETTNRYSPQVRSFQILNSPICAPASQQVGALEKYCSDTSLFELIESFWENVGGFDIVHFHNLEGLSRSVLKLKETHPLTRFFFSLHNYMLFCPQVNLWTTSKQDCYLNPEFPGCSMCTCNAGNGLEVLLSRIKAPIKAEWKQSVFYAQLKKMANMVRRSMSTSVIHPQSSNIETFINYRKENVYYINKYIDRVFAVSQRTAKIAIDMGLDARKVEVLYIGTSVAQNILAPKAKTNDGICLLYMGYARDDKGFDILLQALTQLPNETASKIRVSLYARCKNISEFATYQRKIELFSPKYRHVHFSDGYSKAEQKQIMAQADFAVVPALWEDNLPQVMIELIASGIPVLVSDRGGARELVTNPWFVYQADDVDALCNKIHAIVHNPHKLSCFWDSRISLTTIEEHLQHLERFYK